MRVTPLGKVELLSTHDQLLGGPSGQSYFGCMFPADPGYATAITREAAKVGERLASEGVIGRFAIDFVAVGTRRRLEAVCDRAQSPQGRHDAPVPHAAVPHRRHLRPRGGLFTAPSGQAEVLRRKRSRREPRRTAALRQTTSSTSGAHGPPLRPVAPDGRRLPHDERPRRVRANGVDRRRKARKAPTPSTSARSRRSTRKRRPR